MRVPLQLFTMQMILAGSLLAQSVPEIAYDSTPNLLKLPERIHLGEAAGVATNPSSSRRRRFEHFFIPWNEASPATAIMRSAKSDVV